MTISNVDNLGARVDPVVGAHVLAGRPLTCEVARKEGDMGARRYASTGSCSSSRGHAFPPSFDQGLVPVFNTNTALFDLDLLDEDYDLTWLYVLKDVDGRQAVQLERLYHEVSAFVPTQYSRCRVADPADAFSRSRRPMISRELRTTAAARNGATDSDTKSSRRRGWLPRSVQGAGARPRPTGALRDL